MHSWSAHFSYVLTILHQHLPLLPLRFSVFSSTPVLEVVFVLTWITTRRESGACGLDRCDGRWSEQDADVIGIHQDLYDDSWRGKMRDGVPGHGNKRWKSATRLPVG
jgi:hypothetical protein